jgi:3-phenylpropionate/trans-cinnamate dioxygenase ferredoxin reductase component
MEQTFLIVGAGQAGGRAAEALRAAGFKGRVVLVGDETWRPYERPPLSKGVLLADDDASCFEGWLHEETFYADSAIEHVHDRVSRLDTQRQIAVLANGGELHYDRCLLTTGGRARELAHIEADARIVSLRTLDDAMRLRRLMNHAKSVAVIGAGFLGLEFAASARARGLDVSVYEMGARLLPRAVPPAFAERLQAKHEAHGVHFSFDAGALEVAAHDAGVVVTNAAGASSFDFCVLAVGQMPNDALARASGIETANGIVVDEHCRTSAPNVYAAGDCANFPLGASGRRMRLESWQNAQEQAIAAARNMAGEACAYQPTPWFWTDQYDWNIQMLGVLADDIDRWIVRPGADDKAVLIGMRGEVIGYALALNQGGELRALRKLVEQGARMNPDHLADLGKKLRQIERLPD